MSQPTSQNITWHGAAAPRADRERLLGQKGCVVWLTGLSGSGKSTISRRVEQLLLERGVHVAVLDGDNLRHGLNRDLGFSPEHRKENIRRVACVAELFAESGAVCLTAFISPYRADRDGARAVVTDGRFVEVYVDTPIEACEARDPKGLYKKARAGEIAEFTGISAPYEAPDVPELRVPTAGRDVDACARDVVAFLEARGYLPA
jgi:adenylylsulfate kinase